MSQVQIANRLGLSQGFVSKLLTKLVDENSLTSVTIVSPNFRQHPQWQQMIDQLETGRDIAVALQQLSPVGRRFRLELVRPGPHEPHGFEQAAAPVVQQLLVHVRRLGIGCGATIAGIMRELGPLLPTLEHPPHVIPIVGEPTHLTNVDQSQKNSATLMAELFRHALGSSDSHAVLRGVAAYIPRRFAQRGGIAEFFHSVPGYRTIFGSDDDANSAEINKLDCIITGAGIVSPAQPELQGTLIRERLAQENLDCNHQIEPETLDRLVYGDLAGILIPRQKISPAGRKLVETLNKGLTGLRRAHLERVCQMADGTSSPGVVLIAFGEQKLELIREIIRTGLATTLVTTLESARQLASSNGVSAVRPARRVKNK